MSDSLEAAAQALYARLKEPMGQTLPWSSLTHMDKQTFINDVEVVLSVYEDHERRQAA